MKISVSRTPGIALLMLTLAASGPLLAAEPELNGQRLAASCANCHGSNGHPVGDAIAPLAGQTREALMTSLKEFKAGKREATIMHQIAKGYTDEQLAVLASFFAAQSK